MIACVGYSGKGLATDTIPHQDTICLTISQVIQSIRAKDSLKIMKQELDSTDKLVNVLQDRIKSKDSTITDYKKAEVTTKELIETFKLDKSNLLQQVTLQREDTKFFKDLYRKQNNKAWITSLSGIIVTIATYFIFRK